MKKNILILSTFIFSLLIFNSQIMATNGYFRHGYGIKYSALAGAGVAVNLSSLGAITNPAGLVYMDNSYDINIALFSPNRSYDVIGNPSGYPGTFGLASGKIESNSKYFPMPTLGANWKLNPTMAFGIVIYGNGGMNSNYPTKTFYDPNSPGTGVNIMQLFVGATYSIEVAQGHAFGITAIFGYQTFAAKGLLSFANFSSDPNALTGNKVSTSTGFGAKIGYQGKLTSFLTFGAAFQTKMYMSKFKDYAGLFAEQGGFDVPANWTAGFAVKANSDLTFLLDVQEILYSGVNSVGNPLVVSELSPVLPDGSANPNFKALGTDEGAGFGWKDMWVIKFGTMWQSSPDWTWMVGYSYGTQPIPNTEVLFNILAPAVVQHHITAGVTRKINQNNEISLAFMYAPASSVTGANPLEAPNQQQIKLEMSQWQIEVGYAFH